MCLSPSFVGSVDTLKSQLVLFGIPKKNNVMCSVQKRKVLLVPVTINSYSPASRVLSHSSNVSKNCRHPFCHCCLNVYLAMMCALLPIAYYKNWNADAVKILLQVDDFNTHTYLVLIRLLFSFFSSFQRTVKVLSLEIEKRVHIFTLPMYNHFFGF